MVVHFTYQVSAVWSTVTQWHAKLRLFYFAPSLPYWFFYLRCLSLKPQNCFSCNPRSLFPIQAEYLCWRHSCGLNPVAVGQRMSVQPGCRHKCWLLLGLVWVHASLKRAPSSAQGYCLCGRQVLVVGCPVLVLWSHGVLLFYTKVWGSCYVFLKGNE